MKLVRSLFSESGDISMVRVMAFIVCLTACYLALSKGPDEVTVIGTLLSTAFGAKVAQKFMEGRGNAGPEVR